MPLCLLPTPLHRLDRASDDLGIDLWIKRDDLTGFAMGGNKGRKLEFLVADAVASGATAVVTSGAAQSNFVRQLGAACTVAGLRCGVAAMALPYEDKHPGGGMPPVGGNALLMGLLGVEVRLHPDGTWDELERHADALQAEWTAGGERVRRVPLGGSSALGAYGFYLAGGEVVGGGFDRIIFASSSGSTQTGLARRFAGTETAVCGIACDPEPLIREDYAVVGNRLERLLDGDRLWQAEDYDLDFGHVGPGYGVPSEAGDAALKYLARTEGIFLDPIYTGKAFAGLLHRARAGELPGRTLFWHTGGLPAIFVPRNP